MQAFICLKLFFKGVIRIQLQILFIMINLSLEKPPGWRKANFLNGKNIFSTNIFHEFQFIIKIEIIVFQAKFLLKIRSRKINQRFFELETYHFQREIKSSCDEYENKLQFSNISTILFVISLRRRR